MINKFDFLIVGSGFSGSITAMALLNSGYSVCLIEKGSHPRFAIGESSTPIADMILRDLADNYNLPFLKKLSRYGDWQKNYPEVVCGLKRGFSYYHHTQGKEFSSDASHSKELLVAASENDNNSDTNWLRSDVDQFLVKKAIEIGVNYFDKTTVNKISRDPKNKIWSVYLDSLDNIREIECKWIIDATGNPAFSTTFFNTTWSAEVFKTNSSAIYTHFDGVDHWLDYLNEHNFETSDYPYHPDYSALHQIIEEGWIWMLRFNNNRLSAGLLLDHRKGGVSLEKSPQLIWTTIIDRYPSLKEIFKKSALSNPPNRFFKTKRLQRRLDNLYGNGWVVMPHTAGFVDPLHSTGIAFTMSGVEYLLEFFTSNSAEKEQYNYLKKYQDKVFKELSFIDLLVSISYRTRHHFELFKASTMLYFIASIHYEQRRLRGEIPDTFLSAGDTKIFNIVDKTYRELVHHGSIGANQSEVQNIIDDIRKRIEPFNTVGLMDPGLLNMYKHTAVEL